MPSVTVTVFLLLPLLTLHIKTIHTGLSVQQDQQWIVSTVSLLWQSHHIITSVFPNVTQRNFLGGSPPPPAKYNSEAACLGEGGWDFSGCEGNYITLLEIKLNGIDPVHMRQNQHFISYFLPKQKICARQMRFQQCWPYRTQSSETCGLEAIYLLIF